MRSACHGAYYWKVTGGGKWDDCQCWQIPVLIFDQASYDWHWSILLHYMGHLATTLLERKAGRVCTKLAQHMDVAARSCSEKADRWLSEKQRWSQGERHVEERVIDIVLSLLANYIESQGKTLSVQWGDWVGR